MEDLIHLLKTNKISLMLLYEFEDFDATECEVMWLKPHIVSHETHFFKMIIEVLGCIDYHPLLF